MHSATVLASALLRLGVRNWLHGWQAGARWWGVGGETRTAGGELSAVLAVAERPFLGLRLVSMLMEKNWSREQEQKHFVEQAGVVCVVRRRGGSLCLLGRMMIPKEASRDRG